MMSTQTQHGPIATLAERRRSGRTLAAGRARLCWQDRDGPMVTTADLRDVGAGGAMAVARRSPPVGANVSIRVLAPVPSDWVEATVLDVRRGDSHAILPDPAVKTIRFAFRRACPAAFLDAAAVPEGDEASHTVEFILISAS